MPNITTNHAITYTNSKGKIKRKIFCSCMKTKEKNLSMKQQTKRKYFDQLHNKLLYGV